jgi:LPS export ABC transporter protein LptC
MARSRGAIPILIQPSTRRQHRKTKPILYLVILISIGILLTVFISDRQFKTPQKTVMRAIEEEASLSMEGIRMTSTREGIKSWDLNASSGNYLDDHQIAVFNHITVNFYQHKDGMVILCADKGIYQSTSNDLEVSGQVVIENDQYRMKTDRVQYDHHREMLQANEPVNVTGKAINLSSRSMEYHLGDHRIILQGNVTGIISENIKL